MKLTEKEQERAIRIGQGKFDPQYTMSSDTLFLLHLLTRAIQEPEPQTNTVGLQLTEQEMKAVDDLMRWGAKWYDSVVGNNIAIVLAVLDRVTNPSAKFPLSPNKPKVVFYDYYSKGMYIGNKLAFSRILEFDCVSAKRALECLGYAVEIRRVKWEDMPGDPANNDKGHYAPDSLAELEDHFKNLEASRRQIRIASLKDELKCLEQEALNDA